MGQERSNPEAAIIGAAFDSDVPALLAELERDPGLANARDSSLESTPLCICAHRGSLEAVRALLEKGAELDAREGCSGATALHWAAEAGRVDVARLLIEAGAQLEARDDWHRETPLGWATHVVHAPHLHTDRAGAARLLVEHGARPSMFAALAAGEDSLVAELALDARLREARLGPIDGEVTPLLFAAERGLARGAGTLIDAGADVTSQGRRGLGLRARAYLAGDDATLALIEDAEAPEDLSWLLVSGREQEARALLAREPALLAKDGPYAELVHALVIFGRADALRVVLEAGADANGRATCLGIDEWLCELPPLFVAASRGATSCAELLLAHGAELEARGMRAEATPLHVAALRGHRGVASCLLEHGASKQSRDGSRGSTPAGWARDAGHAELAILLEAGA